MNNVVFFSSDSTSGKAILVVGRGLVGDAICHRLNLFCSLGLSQSWINNDWLNASDLVSRTKRLVTNEGLAKVEVVWAAGHGGFSATQAEMEKEFVFFKNCMDAFASLKSVDFSINLISSAGGIYENSGRVEHIDQISPSRPYADIKLQQERLVCELGLINRIYRLSSVFGLGGVRTGLVTTMLTNANFGKPITIYANQNTLRDYIWNVDCAKQVVADILNGGVLGPRIVASGRPTSIIMLSNMVGRVTGRVMLESYRPNQTNQNDITFSPSVLDANFSASPLEISLKIINRRLKGNGGNISKLIQ